MRSSRFTVISLGGGVQSSVMGGGALWRLSGTD